MENQQLKQQLIQIIEDKKSRYLKASDAIWEFAEIRFQLGQSADLLIHLLEEEGFTIQRDLAGMHDAFVATYGTGGPVIGILGEYDALTHMSQKSDVFQPCSEPACENGHGCGHHGLGTGGALAAAAVKQLMVEHKLSGTIKYFGCPGEESGSGKAFMARDGVFAHLDGIFTWHPMTENAIYSKSSLANYQVFFSFTGKSAHASGSPEKGRSALDAAELMSVGINYLREHIIDGARIHYAYIDAGGISPNVVQPKAKLLYFIRAPKSSQLKPIYERVLKIAQGAALMTETELTVTWDSACAEYVVNDVLSQVVYKNMQELGTIVYTEEELSYAEKIRGTLHEEAYQARYAQLQTHFPHASPETLESLCNAPMLTTLYPYQLSDTPSFSSTDVGDASWQAPTAQFTVASYPNGTDAHSWQWVASGKSSIFHKSVVYAGTVMAASIVDVLCNPEILTSAKAEMAEMLAGEAYPAALPPDVLPQMEY